MTAVVTGAKVYLPLKGLIDVEKEMKRLTKELDWGPKRNCPALRASFPMKGFSPSSGSGRGKEKAKKEDVKARLTALEDQLKELQNSSNLNLGPGRKSLPWPSGAVLALMGPEENHELQRSDAVYRKSW